MDTSSTVHLNDETNISAKIGLDYVLCNYKTKDIKRKRAINGKPDVFLQHSGQATWMPSLVAVTPFSNYLLSIICLESCNRVFIYNLNTCSITYVLYPPPAVDITGSITLTLSLVHSKVHSHCISRHINVKEAEFNVSYEFLKEELSKLE